VSVARGEPHAHLYLCMRIERQLHCFERPPARPRRAEPPRLYRSVNVDRAAVDGVRAGGVVPSALRPFLVRYSPTSHVAERVLAHTYISVSESENGGWCWRSAGSIVKR